MSDKTQVVLRIFDYIFQATPYVVKIIAKGIGLSTLCFSIINYSFQQFFFYYVFYLLFPFLFFSILILFFFNSTPRYNIQAA